MSESEKITVEFSMQISHKTQHNTQSMDPNWPVRPLNSEATSEIYLDHWYSYKIYQKYPVKPIYFTSHFDQHSIN